MRMLLNNNMKKVDSQEVHRTSCCLPITCSMLHLPYDKARHDDMLHRNLSERVLRNFIYEQMIPRLPKSLPMTDIPTIDLCWLWYVEHDVTHAVEVDSPFACVVTYLQWFRRVSHLYDDRSSLALRLH
ncbi:hypothetical protein LR48_Vigan07g210600 [Vigna angularis]|uniref:Aminotransferase-like plant mobile domain-containing protein n=1 Tax=Phaseolus angularis TaxID=3914 RepID=A0A0L9V0K6_PHAAN|nr:hypothetical protein LR48_Vigan07g210600 [Vigna angularis]